MVASGDILVELDHDDELTPDALQEIQDAFANPDIGFVYSDWCELFADGTSGKYPQGWAFGFGEEYWSEEHHCWVMSAPPVNDVTARHIVSMPNHVRAWRASVYRGLNGHNPAYEVADDYELCVRTILNTEYLHIPKLLYKQHIGPHTAQRARNDAIQNHVLQIASFYDASITSKFGSVPVNLND